MTKNLGRMIDDYFSPKKEQKESYFSTKYDSYLYQNIGNNLGKITVQFYDKLFALSHFSEVLFFLYTNC